MSYFCFDTETNGLFRFRDQNGNPLRADAPGQPRMAHAVIIVLNDALEDVETFDIYVRPDGWEMTPETTAINGLTTEFLMENGRPVREALDIYAGLIDAGRQPVAFNSDFDTKVLRAELRRAGMDDRFAATNAICAMKHSMALGVRKADGSKGWPKLSDVCRHLGIELDAHKAASDARACVDIFRHLMKGGFIPPRQSDEIRF